MDEELDVGEVDPALGGRETGFEVLAKPPVAVQPSQGALDDPAPRQNLETLRCIASTDDLKGPIAQFF